MTTQLLMIEDDSRLAQMVVEYLGQSGMQVAHCGDGQSGLARLQEVGGSTALPDLVILDLMLPDMDGLDVCRNIRGMQGPAARVPVLMLTAKGDPMDRIIGLELGADDYLPKPFEPRELLARIRAVLRRCETEEDRAGDGAPKIHAFAGHRLDVLARRLENAEGAEVALTGAEFDLLLVLVERPGRVLSRDRLLDLTQGRAAGPFERSIDILISRIRRKIEVDPHHPEIVKTVRSGGYLFAAEVEST